MSSKSILHQLNLNCLYLILEQNCLDIDDLGEVNSTCVQLQAIAQRIFRNKFRQIDENNNDVMASWSAEKMAKCLRNFGENFTTFCLDGHEYRVPRQLAQYCNNIVSLSGNLYCDPGMKRLYSNLQHLEHSGGTFIPWLLFNEDSPLKHLSLTRCPAILPEYRMSQLEHVKLIRTTLYSENMQTFALHNQQISHLEISSVNGYFLEAIQLLVNLKELTYIFKETNNEPTNLTPFQALSKLERLIVQLSPDGIWKIVSALHTANAPLTHLKMICNRANKGIIRAICKCKGIQLLHFSYDRKHPYRSEYFHTVNGEDLLDIVKNLPQLTNIGCESDDIRIEDILQALKTSKQLQQAYFKIDVNDYEREWTNIEDIAELARKRQISVTIEVFDRLVSDNFKFFFVKIPLLDTY